MFSGAAGSTAEVGWDVDELEPPVLTAVTTRRSVDPTSAATGAYVAPNEPARSPQAAPNRLQRCHWYWYMTTAGPLQLPVFAVSVRPCWAVPAIVGEPGAAAGGGDGGEGGAGGAAPSVSSPLPYSSSLPGLATSSALPSSSSWSCDGPRSGAPA